MAVIFGVFVIVFLVAVLVVKTIDTSHDIDYMEELRTVTSNESMTESTNGILVMQTKCEWIDQPRCTAECSALTLDALNDRLTLMLKTRPLCERRMVDLIINGEIYSQPSEKELSALVFVKTLTFQSTIFSHLAWHLLGGFSELETLNMFNVSINSADPHALDELGHCVRAIVISELNVLSKPLHLSVFTGGPVIKWLLKTVRVQYNLFEGTIKADTFAAIERIEILVLAGCQIEVIERGAFDQLQFLERLNLSDNRIRVIADGLFDKLLPSYSLYIDLHNNSLTCGCEVCYLKRSLWKYWWTFTLEDNLCDEATQTQAGPDPVEDYCSDQTCRELAYAPPISTTTPATTKPTVDRDANCVLHDYHDSFVGEVVKVSSRNRIFRIENNHDGTVNVTIKKHALETNLLVWFDSDDKHSQSVLPATIIHDEWCRAQLAANDSVEQTVRLDIRAKVPYTFCVMTNISEQYLVSPFNCVAYQKNDDSSSEVWFSKEAKTFTVTMLAMGIVLIFGVGLMLGFWMMRRCRCCRKRACAVDSMDGDPGSKARDVRSSRRISQVSTISAYSYETTSGDHTPSRFEIVQRQLAQEQRLKEQRQKHEATYYLQSFNVGGTTNIYESSSATPEMEAPTQPAPTVPTNANAPSVADLSQTESENYYSNAELLFQRK